ncbi:MAG: hypothetical protein ACRDA0_06285 [Cetobacterium sp.]|uniref:hypothetical protein n=1 Tax=Cetobacterium sp. TaxID=2071632 RepID=UPI003F317C77
MFEMKIKIKIDENKLSNLILEGKENFIIPSSDENVKIDQNKVITKKEIYNWKNIDFIISNFLKLKQLGIISS